MTKATYKAFMVAIDKGGTRFYLTPRKEDENGLRRTGWSKDFALGNEFTEKRFASLSAGDNGAPGWYYVPILVTKEEIEE